MKTLVQFIKEKIFDYPDECHLFEMATIGKDVVLNKERKSIQIHGLNSGDRENPHIHIYNHNDKINFNFEISLVDLICYDELIIIAMKDKQNHINIKNRNKCSWDGYSKLKYEFDDWLSKECEIPGDYKNNLDAIIYWYNRESEQNEKDDNPFLEYLSKRNLKVHSLYRYLFNKEDLEKYEV